MSKKFKMPARSTLKQRISTINNAFAMSITPYIRPDNSELNDYYKKLKIYWSSETMQEVINGFSEDNSEQCSLDIIREKLK